VADSAITCTVITRTLSHFRTLLDTGDLVAAGPPMPAWPTPRRLALMAAIERHWPTGPIVIWHPTGNPRQPGYLLDGVRRLTAADTTTNHPDPVLRDLTVIEPAYTFTATADGVYLPIDAVWHTVTFLETTRALEARGVQDAATRRHAENIADAFHTADVVAYRLHGGAPADIHALCRHLIPGRTRRATLDLIAARAHRAVDDQRHRP